MRRTILIGASVLLFWAAVRADDIKLKDGSKISGSIVGFDDNSFKVQTSYGFALVRKDQVVSITVSNPAKPGANKSAADAPVAAENANPSKAASSAKEKASTPAASDISNEKPKTLASATPESSASVKPAAPAAPAAVPPPAPAALPPIREKVDGSTYINETYRFRMYKPPDWQVIQGARAALPGSVAALGTSDQSTYLIIGIEPADDTLLAHVTVTNDRLADSFDNFRPSALRQTLIGGFPACEYQFEGMAENQLWAGTVALVRHGQDTFTIFGVTTAKSDLVQIQQNVISRAIASLQFTTAQAK